MTLGAGGDRARASLIRRARCQGTSILGTNSSGPPQHAHSLGGRSGLGGGNSSAPNSSGRPVRNAIFSRFAAPRTHRHPSSASCKATGMDMWLIINTSFSRKVRSKPIEIGKQIEDVRLQRAEGDEVFPLDLRCPDCGLEMQIEFALRLSTTDPKRKFFIGHCPDGSVFFYYHTDGWKPEREIKDGEQAVDAPPH